jgi:antitoxin component YwqK of YwqJK toxin-antitoxin module
MSKVVKNIAPKKSEVIRGFLIKYHANGKTKWSKGKVKDGKPQGYWEWYRLDGSLKRSGYFEKGKPVGKWVTYDQQGKSYKVTNKIN